MRPAISRTFRLLILVTIIAACAGPTVFRSPDPAGFDTSTVDQLLREALAEIDRLAASPPPVELPDEITSLLERSGVSLPAVPSNAAELCDALGTPDPDRGSAGLGAILEGFVTGGEVGLAAALLTTVVFSTCPTWSPHLETTLRDLF